MRTGTAHFDTLKKSGAAKEIKTFAQDIDSMQVVVTPMLAFGLRSLPTLAQARVKLPAKYHFN